VKVRGWLGAGFAVLVLMVAVSGCGSSPTAASTAPSPSVAAPRSPFPSRPAELRLNEVDPCTLLTTAQQGQLGVEQLSLSAEVFDVDGKDCGWGNTHGPREGYGASTDLRRGADYALASSTGTQVVQVDGYGAVATTGGTADPAVNCVLLIDVAAGQSLWAAYDDSNHDKPGLTHEIACQKAMTAARMMLGNLRTLVH
jgi:hypothetical protein